MDKKQNTTDTTITDELLVVYLASFVDIEKKITEPEFNSVIESLAAPINEDNMNKDTFDRLK